MFEQLAAAGIADIHFKSDPNTQLQAIIAIHDVSRGPAIGGCRFIEYADTEQAIADVIRLARGMSYKAALAGLPHGGAKSVILKPAGRFNRQALFQRFGEFVDELGGRYITAMDSGTQVGDMDIIARATPHVSCTSASGDPSPATAYGVFLGIQQAVRFRLRQSDLKGVRVAVQGLGHVGYALCQRLYDAGAQLLVTDLDQHKCQQAQADFAAEIIAPERIYSTACDVFAPCGLGTIINERTVTQLKCSVIAGSANNQLASDSMGQALQTREILYCPDYLINAGGLVFVALKRQGLELEQILQRIETIGQQLAELFQQSLHSHLPINQLVDQRAEQILYPQLYLDHG